MERMREFTAQYYIPLAIVSFILVSPAMFFSRNSEFMFSIGFSLLSAGYAIFIALVVCQGFGRLEKSIAGKCIANIGQWSYNIYLWHFFIAYLLPGVIFEDPMIAISNLDIASELIFIIQGTYYVFLSIALSR
jgi:peptidoglycan/LPS O-acetylase OafA/YrhL